MPQPRKKSEVAAIAKGEPFHFSLWRHIRGHAVTLQELQELLEYGITSDEVLLFDDKGSLVKAYLRLEGED